MKPHNRPKWFFLDVKPIQCNHTVVNVSIVDAENLKLQ